MKIRFYNARILPMVHNMDIMQGEVWVEDSKIIFVGNPKEHENYLFDIKKEDRQSTTGSMEWDREIDLRGNLIMPGFKNAHTHSAMTFLRSYADDLPLMDWLNQKVFPMEAKLSSDDIYHLSKLAFMEYLTSGITADFDMYFDPAAVARASVDCGFRTVLVGAMNDFKQSPEEIEGLYQEYNQYHELISFCLGAHAEYTTSKKRLEALAELAYKYQAPVFLHNSETEKEVAECIQRYGMTPTTFLNELGMFDYGGGGYHCVYMTEEDLAIFQKKKLYVVTNPGSNTKLASGVAPIKRMQELGIPIAIGTDGPASNNCLDMFREMFLVTGLAKLRQKDASVVDAEDVLRMATVNGAHAMGLMDSDCLAEGKLADLTVIDLNQPNMQPLNHITKNIVYSGSKQNVMLTMVNGKILYENGVFHIGTDAEEVYAKANEIIDKIRM